MIDLLTTRQVQNLLKVDRITIYRMLQAGRLKGVKIGQQWRFHDSEVQRLMNGSLPVETQVPTSQPLPVHCLQTVQNLFSRVSQLGGLVVDLAGEPVTALSTECALCQMMQGSQSGAQACRQSWRDIASGSADGEREFTCHAGLTYLTTPVLDGETPAGWLLVGQVNLNSPDPEDLLVQSQAMSRTHSLPTSAVQESRRKVPLIPSEKHDQLHTWVIDAAKAMESILQERAGFLQRMQQIADLTHID